MTKYLKKLSRVLFVAIFRTNANAVEVECTDYLIMENERNFVYF